MLRVVVHMVYGEISVIKFTVKNTERITTYSLLYTLVGLGRDSLLESRYG